ncbi:hypothetical protein OUZ56_009918 [Daphnia magna]|uniref:Uncharacterized protein n=1 Tax=Daphnia magna TaxID=35525 RepID=A0ABR0AH84_9CRUS|nr:hypothetical protein OUZ56_009918 [Daphnia magna]
MFENASMCTGVTVGRATTILQCKMGLRENKACWRSLNCRGCVITSPTKPITGRIPPSISVIPICDNCKKLRQYLLNRSLKLEKRKKKSEKEQKKMKTSLMLSNGKLREIGVQVKQLRKLIKVNNDKAFEEYLQTLESEVRTD